MSHREDLCSKIAELERRVLAFRALELPGQPPFMHMGTPDLINDLMEIVTHLSEEHLKDQAQ